jgi:hypothetical protein
MRHLYEIDINNWHDKTITLLVVIISSAVVFSYNGCTFHKLCGPYLSFYISSPGVTLCMGLHGVTT